MGGAEARQQAIEALGVLEIKAKVGSEGKLFGSIGNVDIADAVTASGVPVEKREIRLPDGPIRTVGEHTINIHIYTDVDCSVSINVIEED